MPDVKFSAGETYSVPSESLRGIGDADLVLTEQGIVAVEADDGGEWVDATEWSVMRGEDGG